jgi:hypothetical protein
MSRPFAGRGFGGGRSFAARNFGSGRGALFGSRRSATFGGMRNAGALSSRAVAGALRNGNVLRDPGARAFITASVATAGLRNGPGGGIGWWQHGNGGYGWVGPLFWPFAYYDINDYALWGYGPPFWDYGYDDIYAGIFAPYGYADLAGYFPRYAGGYPSRYRRASAAYGAPIEQLARMCGEDSRDIVSLPVEQIQQAIQLTDVQRAALDDFTNASARAAQDIKAACPTDISLTAPSRLAAMQQRIEAMIAAVQTVQPSLNRFYDLLTDEQKALLTALGEEWRKNSTEAGTQRTLAESCGAARPGLTEWPTAEIERSVHPPDAQQASLAALQDAGAKASDMLKASCQPDTALTPPARLAAVGKRLDAMLQAVRSVRSALDDFYGTLSGEQKAQFEAIGLQRTGQRAELPERPRVVQRHIRRRHIASVGGVIRHLFLFGP